MTVLPARALPPRLTLAEARDIVTDPHHGAATHPILRQQAWLIVKAAWMARRARTVILPKDPANPEDAA